MRESFRYAMNVDAGNLAQMGTPYGEFEFNFRGVDQNRIKQVTGAVGPVTGRPSAVTDLPFDSISSCWR